MKPEHYETVIVGAGPAGMQMGYFLGSAGRSYLILETESEAGTFYKKFPRHRTLISLNKRFNFYPEPDYNLRHDWNSLLSNDPSLRFTSYSQDLYPSADDYVRYLQDYARKLELRIRYGSRATSISKRGGVFTIACDDGTTYTADRVMMATGPRKERLPLDLVGIEHAATYATHSLDVKKYENKRVCIIGGKNSAFEVADHLAGHAAIITMALRSPIKHAWNTHFPGDLRAINCRLIEMFQLKTLHAVIGLVVKEIKKQSDGSLLLTTATEVPHWDPPQALRAQLVVDKVIICTGWEYVDFELFDGIAPETTPDGRLPVLSPDWESTVQGMYFIGTTMQARDRVTASPFVHGFRYNIRTLFHLLEERHHGVELPSQAWHAPVEWVDVAQALAQRMTTADALYPLRGFLGDVLVYEAEGRAKLIHDLPLDLVLGDDSRFAKLEHMIVSYLEFGWTDGAARGRKRRYPPGPQPIQYVLPSDHAKTGCSAFLHPVFEYYRRGELVKEMHLQESLVVRFVEDDYADFNKNINRNRIHNFLSDCLGLGLDKLNEDFVPADKREQFYVPMSAERIEELRRNPDPRRCPDKPYSELRGDDRQYVNS